ncbi:hypothetical protein [Desulfoscipio geothermicus]|uniref:Peptidase family M41 n=1 Tax=Desulfoscipio geothermicus DSM 3669 TaxID=1121426 RepID=A0A1I6E4L6_9FIRM|nr:hypothetical protein [Desulfoscipio geothermicus]SFR12636.1 Peptidase family M41 [Desulfoscipio geothermicus DSM 3669]
MNKYKFGLTRKLFLNLIIYKNFIILLLSFIIYLFLSCLVLYYYNFLNNYFLGLIKIYIFILVISVLTLINLIIYFKLKLKKSIHILAISNTMLTFAIITACLIYLNAPKKDNFSFLESHYHQTSIHECGHVIVSEILSPGSIERVVLITPERAMWLSLFKRNEGGITYYKDIIKELPKLSSFEIHICRSLGGLAATNVFFPEDKYAGALADINQAKDLIIAIVNNGISEFGVATWDVLTDRQKSTLTNKIMDEQYNRAVKIVLSNKKSN